MSQAQLHLTHRLPRRRLGALRHHNYRLFFTGQTVSAVGTWMQSVAISWLVLETTNSALAVGAVLAVQFLPMLLGAGFGGRLVDRLSKRDVLLATQSAYMVPALALFALSATHQARLWMVVVAALAVGLVNVFDMPIRQAFVIDMVGREDLVNAIALNSSVFNAAAVVGPALAGLLIGSRGVYLCFAVNAASYLVALIAVWLMRDLPALAAHGRRAPGLEQVRDGADYIRTDPMVALLLLCVAGFSLFAMNRLVLIPLFAKDVLGVGPSGFGLLVAALGLGSLAGAVHLALSARYPTGGRRQFWLAMIWVATLELFSVSRLPWLSAAVLLIAGYCQITFLAIGNSRIQAATPDGLRGRVMALYGQAVMGMSPLGSFQAGVLAQFFGPPIAQAVGAGIAGVVVIGVRVLQPAVFNREVREGRLK